MMFFLLAAEDRQARMCRVQAQIDDLLRRKVGIDHLDLAAVEHDFLNRSVT